ncbi:MAG: type III pantothenate kinase [Immundisolibacteraceae bacterium]|nr:type III pantothenate kinase [Immundisolibacteraceae bacterium]
MLLIDVGNSRIKAAYSTDLSDGWAVSYQQGDRRTEIDLILQYCQRNPRRVILSCVNDQRSADYIQLRSSKCGALRFSDWWPVIGLVTW